MPLQLISETTDCDYKETVERSKPRSWLKSVSAFANTSGGVLVFGIDDVAHKVVGLAGVQADADFISEKIKERIEPLPRFEVEAENDAGRDVLLVHTHADAHPPYYYSADGRLEAYIRVGNQSVIAPPEVLNELILRGANRTWGGLDSQIPRNRTSFSVLRPTYANRMHDSLDEADVESFGLFTDHGTLTNAGAPLPEDVVATRVKSERRNPVIADVFSRMNLMERRGSGLREICMATAAEDAYKPEFKPVFESKQQAFWVTPWNMNYVEGVATGQVGAPDGTQVRTQDGVQVGEQVAVVLAALGDSETFSNERMQVLGFTGRSKFQQNYLKPALESDYVEMTIPDKPSSRNQKYRRVK